VAVNVTLNIPVVPHQGRTHRPGIADDPDAVRGHLPGHDPRAATGRRHGVVRQAPEPTLPAAEPEAPDGPVVFADTSYPWSAVGRVDVPGGWGSGVLVGPRHLLTAAHIIPWVVGESGVSSVGWVRFVPGAFESSEPFGSASAVAVYCLQPTHPPSIDAAEERVDFAVCVLDHPIGRLTGWMGVQAYRDAWDHLARWSHVGYRGTQATATRPSYQAGLALNGRPGQADTHQAMLHRGDVHPGQSGGPFFGWWAGEDCPRVVAVQSWGWPGQAGASGGESLVDMVVRARQEHP
jgi:V8-like Glu-specific endopeptidase